MNIHKPDGDFGPQWEFVGKPFDKISPLTRKPSRFIRAKNKTFEQNYWFEFDSGIFWMPWNRKD
jgi:hypothetical protein